jgi:hypothetical protein
MAGMGEEGVKVVSGVVESLKAQPLSLALVIMNLTLLAFFWYIAGLVAATREREVKLMYESQGEIREFMSRCVVQPAPKKDGS